jgi:hypothetical protein
MSKFVNVPSGGYKITVAQGQTITLDTNPNLSEVDDSQGKVVITGDLEVRGNQTNVESENMVVKDNVIIVNDGDPGPGITLDQAGLQVNRGTGTTNDVFFVYDENTNSFVFRKGAVNAGSLVTITTNQITTGGENLVVNTGTNVISVTGTTNYEQNVTDDDDITNKKYVDDAIISAFQNVFLGQIGDGVIDPSTVKVLDNETTGLDSLVQVNIDNNTVAEFYEDRLELTDIRVIGTTIETITSNEDLILSAPGTGSVVVRDILEITSVPGIDTDPLDPLNIVPPTPDNGVKIYINNENTGGTGIYFANAEGRRDEIISNNRSLVYGMIF